MPGNPSNRPWSKWQEAWDILFVPALVVGYVLMLPVSPFVWIWLLLRGDTSQ